MEIDYKSECMAGQTVESLGSRVVEDTNGTGFLRCGPLIWTAAHFQGAPGCASLMSLPTPLHSPSPCASQPCVTLCRHRIPGVQGNGWVRGTWCAVCVGCPV